MNPKDMLVPYTDVTLWPTFDISTAPAKSYLLGFVVADSDSEPSWGGYHKTTSDFYVDMISKVRQKGGDVYVSFNNESMKFADKAHDWMMPHIDEPQSKKRGFGGY